MKIKNLKSKMKENKAITLIALVITIIILLILAGVSIATLTESGLFNKAKQAEQKSENAQIKEEITLGDYENKISEYVTGTREGLLGTMVKLTTTGITSSNWTKMELSESIDNYKYIQLANMGDMNSDVLQVCNSLLISTEYFKNNYNNENKYVDIFFLYGTAQRNVMFYYNTTEKAVYAKTAYSGYYPVIFGIK